MMKMSVTEVTMGWKERKLVAMVRIVIQLRKIEQSGTNLSCAKVSGTAGTNVVRIASSLIPFRPVTPGNIPRWMK